MLKANAERHKASVAAQPGAAAVVPRAVVALGRVVALRARLLWMKRRPTVRTTLRQQHFRVADDRNRMMAGS